METMIFWFSGTGNSLHVAKRIEGGLENAELVPVAAASGKVAELPERMGLVFPVYAWGPPALVGDFIARLPDGAPDYVFAVATCGGSAGSAIALTRRMLAKKGIGLDASMTLRMVENYPPMGGAPAEEKRRTLLEDAECEIDSIVARIARCWRGRSGKGNLLFSLLGRIAYPLFRKYAPRQAARFLADEKCTSCGVCVNACPVSNIEPDGEGRPVWGRRCQQCFACFHWCPEEAVQFGRKTREQPRYHHPAVALGDMLVRRDGETG